MTTKQENRDKITARIRALLSKTQDNGATEAEAMAAAEAANKLMVQYGIETIETEEDLDEERYGTRKRPFAKGSARRRTRHPVQFTHNAIMLYTSTKCWYEHDGMLSFFGTKSDTEFAHYLSESIANAMDAEWNTQKDELISQANTYGQKVHGNTLRASFMRGMASRVSDRLYKMSHKRNKEMHNAREKQIREQKVAIADAHARDEPTPNLPALISGTALVHAKRKRTEAEFNETGVRLSYSGRSRYSSHKGAYKSGQRSGNNVSLNRPINGNSTAGLLN